MNGLDQAAADDVYWPALNEDFYRGLPFTSSAASRSSCARRKPAPRRSHASSKARSGR